MKKNQFPVHKKRRYYSIIKAKMRYDVKISSSAKLLYGEIFALCSKEGYCWATNRYFCEIYGKDERTIRRWVEELRKAKYIFVAISCNKKKQQNQRRIYLPETAPEILRKLGGGGEIVWRGGDENSRE